MTTRRCANIFINHSDKKTLYIGSGAYLPTTVQHIDDFMFAYPDLCDIKSAQTIGRIIANEKRQKTEVEIMYWIPPDDVDEMQLLSCQEISLLYYMATYMDQYGYLRDQQCTLTFDIWCTQHMDDKSEIKHLRHLIDCGFVTDKGNSLQVNTSYFSLINVPECACTSSALPVVASSIKLIRELYGKGKRNNLLYMMLCIAKYIHPACRVLVKNPSEYDVRKLNYITMEYLYQKYYIREENNKYKSLNAMMGDLLYLSVVTSSSTSDWIYKLPKDVFDSNLRVKSLRQKQGNAPWWIGICDNRRLNKISKSPIRISADIPIYPVVLF